MKHKLKFFDHGATPNMVVKMDPAVDKESFTKWIEFFRANHEGPENAYKTMFLGGGADATVIGSDIKQIDFTAVQAHGEARIAAAAGVPAVIVGAPSGLERLHLLQLRSGSPLIRDTTLHYLWRTFAQSMQDIADVPHERRTLVRRHRYPVPHRGHEGPRRDPGRRRRVRSSR